MSLPRSLTKSLRKGYAATRIGHTLVVHADAQVSTGVRVLAESLPPDPTADVVVADIPLRSPTQVWRRFASAVPRSPRPMRIVPGQEPFEASGELWPWLANEVGRVVIAPCGKVHYGRGWLFVHADARSGWVAFPPGGQPMWDGKRFPRPVWDTMELAQGRLVGPRCVAEPVPAGAWVRPDVDERLLAASRAMLTGMVPCLPQSPTIMLGAAGLPGIQLTDVVGYWSTLPRPIATAARFVRCGAVDQVGDEFFGRTLAEALGTEITCYTGIPAGSPVALDVITLRPDGSPGWRPFVQVVTHRPDGSAPLVRKWRAPLMGAVQTGPGVYSLGPGTVVEVIQAGLWIRPENFAADPVGVRTVPLNPERCLLVYQESDDGPAHLLRAVAEQLAERLDVATRSAARLVSSAELADGRPGHPLAEEPVQTDVMARPSVPPEAAEASGPDAGDGTELPWLSRMIDTIALPRVE